MKKLKTLKISNSASLSVSEMKQIHGGLKTYLGWIFCEDFPGGYEEVCGSDRGKACKNILGNGYCSPQHHLKIENGIPVPDGTYECVCHI